MGRLKKFGPPQNILGLVKGQGIRLVRLFLGSICRNDKQNLNSFAQKVAAEKPPLTKLSEEPKNAKNSPKLGSEEEEDTSFQAISGK